jgi:hypothetical protein
VPAPLVPGAHTVAVVVSAAAPLTSGDVVMVAVRLLAEHGARARLEVLQLVVRTVPTLQSLALRSGPDRPLVAVRPGGRPPAPGVADAQLDLPLRRLGAWHGVLTAVASEPLTAENAALLRGVADALALVADPDDAGAGVAAQAVLDAEADLALVAAELDETVAESLVALRHTDPARVREAATAALQEVRRIGRDLRAEALAGGLRAALAELRRRGAQVHASDPALDAAAPAVAVLVERVAEAACRGAVGTPRITASVEKNTVKLRVESADNAGDASEVERWRRRANALRGELRHWAGGVELSLPAATGNEGRHDDGLDL